jgi:hypothetical protein
MSHKKVCIAFVFFHFCLFPSNFLALDICVGNTVKTYNKHTWQHRGLTTFQASMWKHQTNSHNNMKKTGSTVAHLHVCVCMCICMHDGVTCS